MISEWIRFGAVALCCAAGLTILFLSFFGTYRLRFALNRIHSAAMTDTLALMLFVLGMIIAEGFSFTSLKFLLTLVLLWCTSPLASHMMAKFEHLTDDRLSEHCASIDRTQGEHTPKGDESKSPREEGAKEEEDKTV